MPVSAIKSSKKTHPSKNKEMQCIPPTQHIFKVVCVFERSSPTVIYSCHDRKRWCKCKKEIKSKREPVGYRDDRKQTRSCKKEKTDLLYEHVMDTYLAQAQTDIFKGENPNYSLYNNAGSYLIAN